MAAKRLLIDRLAFGGSGVGRIDGKVCFVPYSCPGDELLVRITSEKRSFATATIDRIVSPSPLRTAPPCPLFGVCGGCDWQHIAYECQTEWKGRILAEALWRGARVETERVRATVASPVRFGYRSRVQFKVYGRGDRLRIGFFRSGSHFVEDLPVEGCPIALPVINEALRSLRQVLAHFPEPDRLPQINIDTAEQGAVAIVHYLGQDVARTADFFAQHADALHPLTALFVQTGRKATMQKAYGDGRLAYSLPGSGGGSCRLGFRPGGFSQVNAAQNATMLGLVAGYVSCGGGGHLLDLYCGNGNLSLPLARNLCSVTGIEEYGDSIAAAIDNAAANGIANVEFLCRDAASGVRLLADQGRRYDAVLLDPPRSGAADVVPELHRLDPEKIIYVSCDPSTLARDCGILRGSGYAAVESHPVDMFPQTYHLESVTLFQRM